MTGGLAFSAASQLRQAVLAPEPRFIKARIGLSPDRFSLKMVLEGEPDYAFAVR
jgi:hypothetical protein